MVPPALLDEEAAKRLGVRPLPVSLKEALDRIEVGAVTAIPMPFETVTLYGCIRCVEPASLEEALDRIWVRVVGYSGRTRCVRCMRSQGAWCRPWRG